MKKKIASGFILLAAFFILSACGPSQAELDARATQVMEDYFATQTAIPTATHTSTPPPTSTPTPIPGKFLNPPEFLEEKFTAFWGWKWMEAVEGRRFTFKESKDSNTTFFLVYENNMIGVSEIGGLSDEFINSVLELFISASTREEIIEFKNGYSEPGAYETMIDGFIVDLEILEIQNNYILDIYETE